MKGRKDGVMCDWFGFSVGCMYIYNFVECRRFVECRGSVFNYFYLFNYFNRDIILLGEVCIGL